MKHIIHEETLRFANQRMPTDDYLREHPKARTKDWKKKPMTLKEVDVSILIIGIIGYPRIRLENKSNKNSSINIIEITGEQNGHSRMRHCHQFCLGAGSNFF